MLVYVALSDHVSFLICGWTSVRSLTKLRQRLAFVFARAGETRYQVGLIEYVARDCHVQPSRLHD